MTNRPQTIIQKVEPPKTQSYADVIPKEDVPKAKQMLLALLTDKSLRSQMTKIDAKRVAQFSNIFIKAKTLTPTMFEFLDLIYRKAQGKTSDWDVAGDFIDPKDAKEHFGMKL